MAVGDALVGFITGPSVNVWFMHSVHNLFKRCRRFNADWAVVVGPYIHSNRNELQREFMVSGRNWLMMLDNDMVFNPEDVEVLFNWADANGPGVYAAPYIIENTMLTCGVWDDEVEGVYHPMFALPAEPTRVGVVGGGFTLIHRDVFEATGADAFSPVFADQGEDLAFSWRAGKAGFTPWLIPESNPGHHKTVVLYPSAEVRNIIGEEINLVLLDREQTQEQGG